MTNRLLLVFLAATLWTWRFLRRFRHKPHSQHTKPHGFYLD